MTAIFYGQRLRTARNFYGYSLEDIGQAVAATRQYIQQIETHVEKQPTREMVLALADMLNVAPSFFYTPESNTVTDHDCHFRKLQTTPVGLKNQAVAHGALFEELAEAMDQILDLPPVNFPTIHAKDMADIERVAEACRMHWGLGVIGPIKNMVRVAENAGALITCFKGVSEKIDAFSMHRRRPLIIRNPAKESACRMRLDIAHECGHIVMHEGVHTGNKQTEDEANRFASAFLLPRAAFLKEFPRTSKLSWSAIYNLKLRWKVSAAAIVRRAYDLNLIDAARYRTANVHLRKTGEARCERYDTGHDAIPIEMPELIVNAFSALESHAPTHIYQLLSTLQIRQGFLEKLINKKLKLPSSDNMTSKSDMDSNNTKILKFSKT